MNCFLLIRLPADIHSLHFLLKSPIVSFTYLGVNVVDKFSNLFSANFSPLLKRTELDLKCWSSLPLSVAGRINSIRMNILPKFTYLFQCIPVFIPNSFFHKLNSIISSFLWNHKSPHLARSVLQHPKCFGGMAAPDFQAYYWASNIRAIVHWLYEDPGADAPSWYVLEALSHQPSSLPALVYSSTPVPSSNISNMVRSTLRIWTQMCHHFGWTSFSVKAPIHSNHNFGPSLIDKSFLNWQKLGIRCFNDLYSDGLFSSFDLLCVKFNLPKSNFFRYLQVRDFLRKTLSSFPSLPPCNHLDGLLEWPGSFK